MSADFKQVSELDPAWLIFTHKPMLEIWAGSIHPLGSLYECAVTMDEAGQAHTNLITALKELGVPHVFSIYDVLTTHASKEELVDLAARSLVYKFEGNPSYLSARDIDSFSEKYKRESVLRPKTAEELSSIIFTRPTVVLKKNSPTCVLAVSSIQMYPLSNLVFSRDQQIVTPRGLVMGNLCTPQRAPESFLMRKCFEIMGVPIVGTIGSAGYEGATLEGGDFLPFSENLAFLGVGVRTSYSAAMQLLEQDLLGARRLAVVQDLYDRSQDRMHLDTIFNIVDEKNVVVWEYAITREDKRRVVDLFERVDGSKEYKKVKEGVDFVDFLKSEGFNIIVATDKEQVDYLINFLSLGRRKDGIIDIISVHPGLKEKLEKAGVTGVNVRFVEYRGITKMLGAAHCSTQVFRCHREVFNSPDFVKFSGFKFPFRKSASAIPPLAI